MTAADLLAQLQRRGVTLERHGNRLRYRPAERVTEAEVATMRAEKATLLSLLAEEIKGRQRTADGSIPPGSAADAFQATLSATLSLTGQPCAWRIYSHRLGRELWICADVAALAELQADGLGGLPAILVQDLERLRGLDDAALGSVLDVCACFPGTRVQDAVAPTMH